MATAIENGRAAQESARELSPRERRKALGDWFRDNCWTKNPNRLAPVHKTSNHEFSVERGGALIPVQLRLGVDDELFEESWFHRHATVCDMTGVEENVPSANPLAVIAGEASYLSGFVMNWTPEDAPPAQSNAQFDNTKLVAKNLGGWGFISNQLVADGGVPLGKYLERTIAKAAAFKITKACFQGGGTSAHDFNGIINCPGRANVVRQTAGTITTTDTQTMLTQLCGACFPYSWWCCSPGAFGVISNLQSFFPAVEIGPGGVKVRVAGLYRGLPVFVTEALPALGTPGDLILHDPRMYILGQRQQIEVAWTDQFGPAYLSGQSIVRAWWRGDGNSSWNSPGTAANGVTAVSAMVCLN